MTASPSIFSKNFSLQKEEENSYVGLSFFDFSLRNSFIFSIFVSRKAQHSTAQHSTAQHSTAQPFLKQQKKKKKLHKK